MGFLPFSLSFINETTAFAPLWMQFLPSSALYRHRPTSLILHSQQARAEGSNPIEGDNEVNERRPRSLLVERYRDGTFKRYILDNNMQLQAYCDKRESSNNMGQENVSFSIFSSVPDIVKGVILPAGFPEAVSEDYLDYMLLQFPTNITGWICYTLVTSSLLKAVGLGTFIPSVSAASAASAAAIKWVSKDGLGAVGRLFIGGRFGNLFDDDPKQWRMYADIIGSAGGIFELSTQIYPAYFLPLAALGNFAKAIARGLKDPSFRVIQNHFAMSSNLGEVAAKEEVWEVTAQILGLAIGILVMDLPGIQTSYSMLAFTWLVMRLLHLWLRYQSLAVLKFHTINMKRARMLVKSHISDRKVPGPIVCNKEENFLLWQRFMQPRLRFGMSIDGMIDGEVSCIAVKTLLELYEKQSYVLSVKQHESKPMFFITFKVGATSLSVLKSIWQAYWLHRHQGKWPNHVSLWLEESNLVLEDGFNDFVIQLKRSGWDVENITLKVPKDILFDEIESYGASHD